MTGSGHGTGAPLPLHGVRVVDLTINISGPYATMILADLGAEVLKVERPGSGDDTRRMAPVRGQGSAYFFAVNRNKRSVVLDLRDPGDRDELWKLLAAADVFVTNLRPTKLRELGLDFAALHNRFPRLVVADLSGYGNEGPEADRAGYDMILQARSGLMSVTGEPGRPPVRVGVSILDMGSGLWLALGVLAALRQRDIAGEGLRVSTSLFEVGAGFMAYDAAAYQLTGELPERRGSEHPAFGPYGVFRARDGFLAIGAGADHIFARLADAVGRPDWPRDPRFSTNAGRMAHREELRSELEERLAKRSVSEWVLTLSAANVPVDEVADIARVLSDKQLNELGCWLEVPLPGDPFDEPSVLRLPGLPIRLSQLRPPVRTGPPPLGGNGPELHPTHVPGSRVDGAP